MRELKSSGLEPEAAARRRRRVWRGVGDGEFDHLGQVRALLKDGYKGALSLETHFTIDDSKAKASEYSMANLLKVVKKV